MSEEYQHKLRNIHRVNRIMWNSILVAILTMLAVVLVFHYNHFLTKPQVENMSFVNNIFFALVVVFVLLGIYVKRTYLKPSVLIDRAAKRHLNITATDVLDFIEAFGKEADLLAKTLMMMRRYYMLIWSLANLVVMVGFIQYIIGVHLDNFLIMCVVGLYALAINFPRFSMIEICYYKIEESK
jgi:heme A synthase